MRRQPKIIRVAGDFKLCMHFKCCNILSVCAKRGIVTELIIACSLSFLHLFGRVSGRGGGFFDFLPLDIVRPGCLLRNFCWARLHKLLFGYPTTSITGV